MPNSITGDKDEVDPITMLLYQIHCQLNYREVTTLAAIANVPSDQRYNMESGLDLFTFLADKDKIHRDYLEMLLTSIRRPDLVDNVTRFYKNEWKYSAYAYTMETLYQTGEIPVVPRSKFKTVGITEEHAYDVYLHYADLDEGFVELIIQQLKEEGVTILSGEFRAVWSEEPLRCRYCVPIMSKAYIEQDLVEELSILLNQEINPGASLKNIIPILHGVTPEYLAESCPALETISQFSYNGGIGEYVKQTVNIIHKGLKTSINKWYKSAVTLQCTSRHQTGKSQNFEISLSDKDSFIVGRSDNSVLFRGDKGIKGLREGSQNGHCVIRTSIPEDQGCGVCVSVQTMGHPLTFVSINVPTYLPHGVSTLLLGREWISIASKRNASQCHAKIRISYVNEDGLEVKVTNPSVREEVTFTSAVTIGSGDGSNLKIQVPGVDIAKHHLKLVRTGGGWLMKPTCPAAYVYLQLPREGGSEPVCVPSGGDVLVGTHTTIRVVINEDIPEDEGIGLSDTCSRMSGKTV